MNTLNLKILDKDLKIACPSEQVDSLSEAARLLDTRMREIRDHGKVSGAEKIAVMAALNLAHDLLLARADTVGNRDNDERIRRMQDKIETLLSLNRQLELS